MNKSLKITGIVTVVIAVIVIACYLSPVRSITVKDLSNEEIYVGEYKTYIIDISGGLFTTISSYHIVSDNPEIADIKFRMAGFNMLRYPAISIKAKKEGTVKFHLENKHGKVKSNTTEITIKNKIK